MCSHSASVETGPIYHSHIQILILTQRVKLTHKKLVYANLIKQQIQLFCCKCSVCFISLSDKRVCQTHAHTQSSTCT